jgi:hypothetical protein
LEQSINKTKKGIEYVVTRTGGPHRAEIVQDGRIIAQLQEGDNLDSVLTTEDGKKYYFSPRVDGKIHPFSLTVKTGNNSGETILQILEHLFAYRGNLYIIGGIPEGKSPKDLGQTKYICRLVNFPYDDVDQVDAHVREKLGRHRGVEVGELSGLGRRGYKVALDGELEPIGLPLSVASYLLYSTG